MDERDGVACISAAAFSFLSVSEGRIIILRDAKKEASGIFWSSGYTVLFLVRGPTENTVSRLWIENEWGAIVTSGDVAIDIVDSRAVESSTTHIITNP